MNFPPTHEVEIADSDIDGTLTIESYDQVSNAYRLRIITGNSNHSNYVSAVTLQNDEIYSYASQFKKVEMNELVTLTTTVKITKDKKFRAETHLTVLDTPMSEVITGTCNLK